MTPCTGGRLIIRQSPDLSRSSICTCTIRAWPNAAFKLSPPVARNRRTDIMRVFQALRRSIKGEKDAKPHVSIAPKSALAIVPPKKVRHQTHTWVPSLQSRELFGALARPGGPWQPKHSPAHESGWKSRVDLVCSPLYAAAVGVTHVHICRAFTKFSVHHR